MQSQESFCLNPISYVDNRNSDAVPFYAGVAQLVEQLIRNEQAAGSSPFTSSKKSAHDCVRIFTIQFYFVKTLENVLYFHTRTVCDSSCI